MRFLLYFVALSFSLSVYAQLKPIGSWTDHLPFRNGTSIATTGDLIFCATESGLFTYNLEDNSIEKFSKVNFLNDIDLSLISYSEELKTLIITYKNGNIDLIIENQIFNIPFIKLSNTGSEPNEIKLNGNLAYISYGFGIVVLDFVKQEIKETFQFGSGGGAIKVNSTQIIGNNIFAATENGFYKANLSDNLLDFNSWELQLIFSSNKVKKLFEIDHQLALVVQQSSSDSAYVKTQNGFSVIDAFDASFINLNSYGNRHDVLFEGKYVQLDDKGNTLRSFLISTKDVVSGLSVDSSLYLIKEKGPLNKISLSSGQLKNIIKPNGPRELQVFDMSFSTGVLWTVGGSHDFAYNSTFQNPVIQKFSDNEWEHFVAFSPPSLTGAFDLVSVTVNPRNPHSAFFSSWGRGLYQITGEKEFRVFNDTSSSLLQRKALDKWVGIGEAIFDDNGNMWVTNTYTREGLSVRKANGEWTLIDLSQLIPNEETAIYDIAISDEGYKWITFPKQNRIIVFDDNGTIDQPNDDRLIELKAGEGAGNVPGIRGIKIEKDRNGLMWIGTSDGIAVHFNPSLVFEQGNSDFSRIIFFDGENNEVVLQNATIKDIAIDGANRKWIGTENSGVLLLSEDGKETVLEFNVDNSPLPSNIINAISIDEETGEVYIATAGGLVSYRSDVVNAELSLSDVKVFPNPVKETYTGPVTISGLMENTTVKITDIKGNLVTEMESRGGSVSWNGRSLNGGRVATGIYLIFTSAASSIDDVETNVGKIMFIK